VNSPAQDAASADCEDLLTEARAEAADAGELLNSLQSSAVAIGFMDHDLHIIRVNREFVGIEGSPVDQDVRGPLEDALPVVGRQLADACRRVLATSASVRDVSLTGAAFGDAAGVHEWNACCYPVRSGDAVTGVGVVAIDVTELVLAVEFRSAVMRQVVDGVFTVDAEGSLRYMNRAASRLLGWSEDEIRGRRMHDVIHFQRPDGTPTPPGDCSILSEATEGRMVRSVGEAFTRKDGTIFQVAYSSTPLRMGEEFQGAVVVFREVGRSIADRRMIRLLMVDSHVMVSEAFQRLLQTQEGVDVVAASVTSDQAIADAKRLAPDVVLIDVDLPDLGGVATARLINDAMPGVSIILMTQSYDYEVVRDAIDAGCVGVLDKNRAWVDLVGAVRAAYQGQTALSREGLQRALPALHAERARQRLAFLTARELEVLRCIAEGLSNRAVADRLGVTANTVRNHVQRILYKLNVHSKLEAIVFAREALADPDA
jgi:PAS domain S-box-containing protein